MELASGFAGEVEGAVEVAGAELAEGEFEEDAGFAEAGGGFEEDERVAFERGGEIALCGFLAGSGCGEGRAETEVTRSVWARPLEASTKQSSARIAERLRVEG